MVLTYSRKFIFWARSFILILSSHLSLVLPSRSFPQFSQPESCMHLSSPSTCYMSPPPDSSWFGHPHNICWAVQITKLLITQSHSVSCYFVPLRPKYLPQHPVLSYTYPVFLPQCDRPSFTPIQNIHTCLLGLERETLALVSSKKMHGVYFELLYQCSYMLASSPQIIIIIRVSVGATVLLFVPVIYVVQ